ncbi:MAG TPA: imidazole glycerol phosphate synthase subunit HisF [Candidatus Caccocola faecipullorum]|nr:imidazole glycerol phosphate synthase subunit HisF [Candidatus Caccocola faecipullorum]
MKNPGKVIDMFGKKIIPCVKVINGKSAEGPVYCGKRGPNDPVECAAAYARAGADGVMFLDVSARGEGVAEVVRRAAAELDVPVAAGCAGSPRELRALREAGAGGVVLGDAAVRNPGLVREAAEIFGRGGVTVAICAQRRGEGYWEVCTESGSRAERMDAYGWALAAEWLGAGELLLVSMERGGRVKPCDADFVKLVAPAVGVPVASACGAADCRELYGLLSCGMASSVVSSTLFRRSETSILTLKRFLSTMGLNVSGAEELLCGDAPELRLCAEA